MQGANNSTPEEGWRRNADGVVKPKKACGQQGIYGGVLERGVQKRHTEVIKKACGECGRYAVTFFRGVQRRYIRKKVTSRCPLYAGFKSHLTVYYTSYRTA